MKAGGTCTNQNSPQTGYKHEKIATKIPPSELKHFSTEIKNLRRIPIERFTNSKISFSANEFRSFRVRMKN